MEQVKFTDKLMHIKKLFSSVLVVAKSELNEDDILIEKINAAEKRCLNLTFMIGIMAMAKSGKSTFINALLGNEFLPVSQKPETALPIKVVHSLIHPNGVLFKNEIEVAEGAEKILKYIKKENEKSRESKRKLKQELKLLAPVYAFKSETMSDVKFEIIDTPGFGEKGETGSKLSMENYERLDEIGVVIYLLDYTKLNFQDEENVLDEILAKYDTLGVLKDRLFFVITKIDISAHDTRHNDGIDVTVENVYNALKLKIPNLNRDKVFHISANNAILARMILANVASPQALSDFAIRAFGEFAYKNKGIEECKDMALLFLNDMSYLPNLESHILINIYNNREKILLRGLVSELTKYVKELQNKFMTAEATLIANQTKITEIENDIKTSKGKTAELNLEAEKQLEKIELFIKNEFNVLTERLTNKIELLTRDLSYRANKSEQSQIVNEINNLNSVIAIHLKEESTVFISELKVKLAENQFNFYNQFSDLVRSEAANFESELGKKLNIRLNAIHISLPHPRMDEILKEANQKLEKFIAVRNKQEKYVDNKNSWCGMIQLENAVKTINLFDINKKALLDFWHKMIFDMNQNFMSLSRRIINSEMKEEVQKALFTFDNFMNQYLEVIMEEKNKCVKGGVEYITQRLEIIKTRQNECESILERINNYNILD